MRGSLYHERGDSPFCDKVAKATIKVSDSKSPRDVNNGGKVNVADHVKLSEILLNPNM